MNVNAWIDAIARQTTVLLHALALTGLALAACGKADETGAVGGNPGSETHWLSLCDSAEQCGEGVCACGVCTLYCASTTDCAAIDSAEVSCVAPASADGCNDGASGVCLPSDGVLGAIETPEAGLGNVDPAGTTDSGMPVITDSGTGTTTLGGGGSAVRTPDSGNNAIEAGASGTGGNDGGPTEAGGDAGRRDDAGDVGELGHPYCGRDDPSASECEELATLCSANTTCCVCAENPSEPACGYFWACVDPDNQSTNCPAEPPLEGESCVAVIGAGLLTCGYCLAEGPVSFVCGRLVGGTEEGAWMLDDFSDYCLQ